MTRSNMLPIDPKKFQTRIFEHKMTLQQLSLDAGHAKNYCTECAKRKVTSKSFLVYLEGLGIRYDDIKPDPEPTPMVEDQENKNEPLDENVTITMKNLAEIVSVAIYTAFVNLHKDGII